MLTDGYHKQLEKMHRDADLKWGNDGKFHFRPVLGLIARVNARTMLDFGCGRSTLSKTLKSFEPTMQFTDYDPGRPKKAVLPSQLFDVVTCTDVLEHVEPEFVDEVVKQIAARTKKAAYFVIDTIPAVTKLPDGRNAHLTVREAVWWVAVINKAFPSHLWRSNVTWSPKKVTIEVWIRE